MPNIQPTPNPPEEIARLSALPLKEYWATPWWETRRYAFIQHHDWRCPACGSQDDLRVTHLSFQHLGAEEDRDLELRCHTCYDTALQSQSVQQNLTVYVHVARETQRLDQPSSLADLEASFRLRCRDLKLPLDDRIDRAIASIARGKISVVHPGRRAHIAAQHAQWSDLPPITRAEAPALLERARASHLVREMPGTIGTSHDPTHETRVRAQADQMRGRGNDPDDERARERRARAEERLAWERSQGAP